MLMPFSFLVVAAYTMVGGAPGAGVIVAQKLDPELLASLEEAGPGASEDMREVEVMLGLTQPLDDATRADLVARGLKLRSEIGDVLTGSVAMRDVARLAESPAVIKVESGRPMRPEHGGELPTE